MSQWTNWKWKQKLRSEMSRAMEERAMKSNMCQCERKITNLAGSQVCPNCGQVRAKFTPAPRVAMLVVPCCSARAEGFQCACCEIVE